jgi:hypothetical protein
LAFGVDSMYPVLFRIGDFEITSFGVLLAVGALVGIWIFGRELRRSGLPSDGVDAAVAGVIGGLIGAKLLWTLEFSAEAPVTDLLFSRGGLSWFGGLVGGVGTGLWMLRRRSKRRCTAPTVGTSGIAMFCPSIRPEQAALVRARCCGDAGAASLISCRSAAEARLLPLNELGERQGPLSIFLPSPNLSFFATFPPP